MPAIAPAPASNFINVNLDGKGIAMPHYLFPPSIQGKPFVKWVGGKGQLLDVIGGALPAELARMPDLTYVEPFVGGGAMLFWMLPRFPNIKKIVINDINEKLIKTYKAVRDEAPELMRMLEAIQTEYFSLRGKDEKKSYYLRQRDAFNNDTTNNVTIAALFIFLNKTCFNGLYRVNSRGFFNVPFGSYENPKICDKETLWNDSCLLRNVEILDGDFEQTLEYATSNAFFYLDPPYKPLTRTSSFNSYAKESFDDSEQIRLKKFCDKLDLLGSRWMLSNSDVRSNDPDNVFFDDLYSSYKIDRVWASRCVNADPEKRGKLTELLITNQP